MLYVHPDRDVTPAVAASRRATLATRRLIAATVNSAAPAADLEAAAALSGRVFFTGTLTVRYRAPTPLHVPVQFEGEIERIHARRIHATARLLVNGEITADAEGVMVTVPEDTFHGAEANNRGVGTLRPQAGRRSGEARLGAQRRKRES